MSSSIRRRACARSEGPEPGSSWMSRWSAIRRSDEATARRRASVGCAVSTGWIRIRSIRRRASAPAARTAGRDVTGVGASAVLAVLAAQRPGALALLGEVGQVEAHGEQPGDPLGRVGVEPADELGGRLRVLGAAPALQLVGQLEEVGATGLLDDLSVQGREQGEVVEHARHARRVGARGLVASGPLAPR